MALIEDIIVDLLEAQSVGAFNSGLDWSIYIGKLPDKPNNAIAVTQSGGLSANPKYLVDYPSVQVLARGQDYKTTKEKIQEVKDALLGLPAQDVLGDRIASITAIGDIVPLGFDDSNRAQFTMNFAMITHPTSGTNRISL